MAGPAEQGSELMCSDTQPHGPCCLALDTTPVTYSPPEKAVDPHPLCPRGRWMLLGPCEPKDEAMMVSELWSAACPEVSRVRRPALGPRKFKATWDKMQGLEDLWSQGLLISYNTTSWETEKDDGRGLWFGSG